jgi:hypothetical protein
MSSRSRRAAVHGKSRRVKNVEAPQRRSTISLSATAAQIGTGVVGTARILGGDVITAEPPRAADCEYAQELEPDNGGGFAGYER